ncbi:MAG TPA: helix-turn-helix transcriptional regulator [Gemmatales bacterium]|nr:helix-turn-helix transcriptional regulator [Gemmatales bacterium]
MVGTVLQSIRHQRNMTQEELASKAKVDRTYVSLLEHNKKSPTVDMLFRLCRALGVRPSVVIARTEKAQSTK